MRYVYIDETGDLGLRPTPGSSPVFGMAAVIVDRGTAAHLREAIAKLRSDFTVPDGVVMSAKRHVKSHDRRTHAARVLAHVPGIRVVLAYVEKQRIKPVISETQPHALYDLVALEISRAVMRAVGQEMQPGLPVHIRFGHVRGHQGDAQRILGAMALPSEHSSSHAFPESIRWVDSATFVESQSADLYAIFLHAAVCPNQFGNVETAYLGIVSNQIVGSWVNHALNPATMRIDPSTEANAAE